MAPSRTLAKCAAIADISSMITGGQIRAARAIIKISAEELARRSGISYATMQRAEQADGMPNMQAKNLVAIKVALESAGIVFLSEGESRDGGPGVRMRV